MFGGAGAEEKTPGGNGVDAGLQEARFHLSSKEER